MSTELTKYEAAKHALAEAKAVDEVKHIHDVAAAMKAYARQAKDRQLEIDASEIRMRAERRLGEMIQAQKATVGLNEGGWHGNQHTGVVPSENRPADQPPTLADVGIDKKLSSRSQAIANIPEDEFEMTLAEHREQQQAVTAKTMDTLARRGAEHATEEEQPPPVFSDADRFANLAILQMKSIRANDPNARKELDRVTRWIAKRKRDL